MIRPIAVATLLLVMACPPVHADQLTSRKSWSRVFGDGMELQVSAISAYPSGGYVVVAGTTNPSLATDSAFDATLSGPADAWVARISESGQLVWASYLGGGSYDWAYGVAVTSQGIYVSGITYSADFSDGSVPDAQTERRTFVVRMDIDGTNVLNRLIFDTGGEPTGMAVRPNGDVLVVGYTDKDLPVTDAVADRTRSGMESWVASISSGTVSWLSYLGGSGNDYITGVAARPDGSIALVGGTDSLDYPVTVGAYETTPFEYRSNFVSVLSGDGGSLVWSTYLNDVSHVIGNPLSPIERLSLTADRSNGIYIAGESYPLPYAGDEERGTAVVHIKSDGSELDKGKFLKGMVFQTKLKMLGKCLAISGGGSSSFATSDKTAFHGYSGGDIWGNLDVAIALLPQSLKGRVKSTLLGGSATDFANDFVIDRKGLVVGGITISADYSGNEGDTGGQWQGFVTKVRTFPGSASCELKKEDIEGRIEDSEGTE